MNRSLPNLTVHQLIYVRAAAGAPTLALAAESLGVSQSALSQGLAEVERRLGVPLFDRRGRTRAPAPGLSAVVGVAQTVLAAVGDLDRFLAEMATGQRGSLRVGMIDTAALGAYARPLAQFRHNHPLVHTTLRVEGSISLCEQVVDGTLDLVIAVTPNSVLERQGDQLSVFELATEPLAIYVPRAKQPLALADVGPWVSYPVGSETRTLITRALATRGVQMEVSAESSNPDVLRQMVRLGVGSCVLPRSIGEGGSDPLEPFEPASLTTRTLGLVRRCDELPNAAADRLASGIREVGAAERHSSRSRHKRAPALGR